MRTQDPRVDRKEPTKLVRTSVLVTAETDAALRDLAAAGNRPLSREIRQALEAWLQRHQTEGAA